MQPTKLPKPVINRPNRSNSGKNPASIAKKRNYGRVEWSVLDWNEPAIEFYKKNGFCRINDIVKRSPDFDILVKMLLTSIKTNTDLKIDDINQIAIMSHLFNEPETNLYYLK